MLKKVLIINLMFMFVCISLFAQTHSSVSLNNHVYYILEQAEMRGLVSPLSGVRPFTRNVVIRAINEILESPQSARGLNSTERAILEQYLERFSIPEPGLNLRQGRWAGETTTGARETRFSADAGVSMSIEGSAGLFPALDSRYFGTEVWVQAFIQGDLGSRVSYQLSGSGGLIQAPRKFLGTYNTFFEGHSLPPDHANYHEFVNRLIDIYSQPLSHFPFTYRRQWDGSVFFFEHLASFEPWPTTLAGGYNLSSELSASFLEDRLLLRFGRIRREWGSVPFGTSLAFNQAARPFLGMEAEFSPVSWFRISSLTGSLEYENVHGIYVSPHTFQNMFSINMFSFRFRNYLFFDFIDAAIWPKRFELEYLSPINLNFFAQNNIGKFDNMAWTFNLRGQHPRIGTLWASVFIDEINFTVGWREMRELARTMVATQAGVIIPLPFMAFSSIRLSYTKINPFTYTHHRNVVPFFGDLKMEKAYINNGVGLGHYLPPNSDEILFRFQTMPARNLITEFNYQMIRRGADFGSNAVVGSNLHSELGNGRNTNPIYRRYFLRDGAYKWYHIFRVGAQWDLSGSASGRNLPVTFFGEAGVVYSFFTNIYNLDGSVASQYMHDDGETVRANVTGRAHPFRRINTPEYPTSTSVIVRLGVRIFPR